LVGTGNAAIGFAETGITSVKVGEPVANSIVFTAVFAPRRFFSAVSLLALEMFANRGAVIVALARDITNRWFGVAFTCDIVFVVIRRDATRFRMEITTVFGWIADNGTHATDTLEPVRTIISTLT